MPCRPSSLLLILVLAGIGTAQDPVSFNRTYKKDEKVAYTIVNKMPDFHSSMTVELEVAVKKLLDDGRAQLTVHMAKKTESGTTKEAPMPADVSFKTVANNLPDKFAPTMGSVDFMDLFLMFAGVTADKKVKVGDVQNVTWVGGEGSQGVGGKGTIKVLSIATDKQQLVAEVNIDFLVGGVHALDFKFKSTYDLADGSLVESNGTQGMGSTTLATMKITRKPKKIGS